MKVDIRKLLLTCMQAPKMAYSIKYYFVPSLNTKQSPLPLTQTHIPMSQHYRYCTCSCQLQWNKSTHIINFLLLPSNVGKGMTLKWSLEHLPCLVFKNLIILPQEKAHRHKISKCQVKSSVDLKQYFLIFML